MHPKQTRETFNPVDPNRTYSIIFLLIEDKLLDLLQSPNLILLTIWVLALLYT
jgi:hypothetical protein